MRFFLVLISFTFIPQIARAAEPPATIPVVKTWEDLKKVPAIYVGDNTEIRLGLEMNKIPQWCGGYLYCLAEGFDPSNANNNFNPENFLGPVSVSFRLEDEKPPSKIKVIANIDVSPWREFQKGTYLYVRALPVDEIVNYKVTVYDRHENAIAESMIEGAKDFYHPWLPWTTDWKKAATPRKDGIALPRFINQSPLTFIKEGDKLPKGDLPKFFPDEKDIKLDIKLDENKITIKSDSKFRTSRPDYHFLARWWVNGKPFVPTHRERLLLRNGYGQTNDEKELTLDFDFQPDNIGAKPGDKIGMQLMHCDSEWEWFPEKHDRPHNRIQSEATENIRVSNKIEFEVPKK